MTDWFSTINEDLGPTAEMEPVLDPETGEVLYYRPKTSASPAVVGTQLSQDEIPIPYVSLPDVPKEAPAQPDVVKPTELPPKDYEVTQPEPVPETPAEQLEKLLPPEPPSDERNLLEKITAPERLGMAKFLEHPGNLVYGVSGTLAELLAGIEEMTPGTYVDPRTGATIKGVKTGTARAAADWLKAAQASSKRGIAKITLTEGQKPVTPLEKLGSYLGEYSQPTK